MLTDAQIEQLWTQAEADPDWNSCDVCHDPLPFARALEQAILAALAQPEPVAEVGQALSVLRFAGSSLDENYLNRIADLLERTEAARLAAELAYRNASEAAFKLNEQLAAERERSGKLVVVVEKALHTLEYFGAHHIGSDKEAEYDAIRAAYQSSQENGHAQ